MDKIKNLKKLIAEESKDYQNLLKGYYYISTHLQNLLAQFEQMLDDGEETDKHRVMVEDALALYNEAKTYLARNFDTFVTEYEGKPIKYHDPQPVSCFSLPPELMDGGSHIWLDAHVYRQFGYKDVLNSKTKDHYIRDGRFLFLKIDLSYPVQTIDDEVGRLVRHAQNLLGNTSTARKAHIQDLFDMVFPKIALSKNRDKALEKTSDILEAKCGEKIDSESLRKRYYDTWKKKNGVSDLRSWRKQKKGGQII